MAGSMYGSDAMPVHDMVVLRTLQAVAVGYAVWTAVLVRALRAAPQTTWLRREHVTMTASIVTMAFMMG